MALEDYFSNVLVPLIYNFNTWIMSFGVTLGGHLITLPDLIGVALCAAIFKALFNIDDEYDDLGGDDHIDI